MLITKTAFLRKNILTGAMEVIIYFPFNQEDLKIVRSIPGRKFIVTAKSQGSKKYWTAPFNGRTIQILMQNGWGFDSTTEEYLKKVSLHVRQRNKENEGLLQLLPKELYPFQIEGVRQLMKWDGRALLADDMGLGKTVQSLMWLKLNNTKIPAVIITPASLKYNWERECQKWLKTDRISVLSGTTPTNIYNDIIIINYDIVQYWLKHLLSISYQTIILDECHYIKNAKAQRTKAVKALCKGTKHIIALSGTAIQNRPIELFNTLNILNPHVFPSRWNFAHKYCDAKHTGFGWDFSGASNMEELHSILKNHSMIRRKKQDVLKELPDKTYNYIPIEISNRKDYDCAKDEFIAFVTQNISDELNETEISLQKELGYVNIALNKEEIIQEKVSSISKAETLVKIGYLQRLATEGIISQVKEWIYNFLENNEKLVLFATHTRFITEIENEFKNISVKIDGSTPVARRQQIVDAFQNNKKIKIFIGNIKAAGVGLTLTSSSNVAFLEYPWSPGDLTQAEDRCHRIGQKNNVNIHYFIAKDTIVEEMISLLNEKQKVIDGILDGKSQNNENLINELLRQYVKY